MAKRKPTTPEKVNVALPRETHAMLSRLADKTGRTRGGMVRAGLESYERFGPAPER